MYDLKLWLTNEDVRNEALEMINELGLTLEDIMNISGFSKVTVNKFLKGKVVAGSTICTIRNEIYKLYKEVK